MLKVVHGLVCPGMSIPVYPGIEFQNLDNPAAHFTNGRFAVSEQSFCVVFHQDIKRLSFLVRIFNELRSSVTQDTTVFHAPRAGDLFILVPQRMVGREIDTDLRIALQAVNFFPLLCRMQVDSIIFKSKVHRNQVWVSFGIYHGDMTDLTPVDDLRDLVVMSWYSMTHLTRKIEGSGSE